MISINFGPHLLVEGLFHADLKGNAFITFKQFKKKDGLNSNNIYLLQFDKLGHLWLGAGGGVDRVSFTKSGEISGIKHFGQNEGFLRWRNLHKRNFGFSKW